MHTDVRAETRASAYTYARTRTCGLFPVLDSVETPPLPPANLCTLVCQHARAFVRSKLFAAPQAHPNLQKLTNQLTPCKYFVSNFKCSNLLTPLRSRGGYTSLLFEGRNPDVIP